MQVKQQKWVFLGTGGTIAGSAATAGDNVGYTAAQVGIEALLHGALRAKAGPCLHWVCEQVAQVDSKDMDFSVWTALVQRCQQHLDDPLVGGLVITHGTDTLEETAWLLHRLLDTTRPVVLTCAMRPASSAAPDGPQNLRDAVAVLTAPGARGVLVVAAGEIHGARQVQKMHPYRLNAFGSGDHGPLGWVEEGVVRLAQNWPPAQMQPALKAMKSIASGTPWPRVEIAMSHAGAQGSTIEALVRDGVQGLVVVATGNGTLHTALEAALERAQEVGVVVRVASRCPLGQIVAASASEGGEAAVPQTLERVGGLNPVKVRVDVLLELLASAAAEEGGQKAAFSQVRPAP